MELFGGSQKTPAKNVIGGAVVHMWIWIVLKFTMSLLSSVVERSPFKRVAAGSSPAEGTKIYNEPS